MTMNDIIPDAWQRQLAAVRGVPCLLCATPPERPCTERGDHLARWLAACTARVITRDDLGAVIRQVVVVTKWCVVPERAA